MPEEQARLGLLAGHLEGQRRMTTVHRQEAAYGRAAVADRRRGPAFLARDLDPSYGVGVDPEARREGEPSVVDPTETDPAAPTCTQRVQQLAGRHDRVAGDAQGAAEHVRAATGHDRERRRVRVRTRPRAAAEQAVDDLVDRAVATEHHHEVDAGLGGLGAELDRMAAMGGLDDVELQVAAERPGQNVALTLGGRGRLGVDDQHRVHLGRISGRSPRPPGIWP